MFDYDAQCALKWLNKQLCTVKVTSLCRVKQKLIGFLFARSNRATNRILELPTLMTRLKKNLVPQNMSYWKPSTCGTSHDYCSSLLNASVIPKYGARIENKKKLIIITEWRSEVWNRERSVLPFSETYTEGYNLEKVGTSKNKKKKRFGGEKGVFPSKTPSDSDTRRDCTMKPYKWNATYKLCTRRSYDNVVSSV